MIAKESQFYVEVVNAKTNEFSRRIGPMSERKADRVESGVLINLNNEDYFTRILEE